MSVSALLAGTGRPVRRANACPHATPSSDSRMTKSNDGQRDNAYRCSWDTRNVSGASSMMRCFDTVPGPSAVTIRSNGVTTSNRPSSAMVREPSRSARGPAFEIVQSFAIAMRRSSSSASLTFITLLLCDEVTHSSPRSHWQLPSLMAVRPETVFGRSYRHRRRVSAKRPECDAAFEPATFVPGSSHSGSGGMSTVVNAAATSAIKTIPRRRDDGTFGTATKYDNVIRPMKPGSITTFEKPLSAPYVFNTEWPCERIHTAYLKMPNETSQTTSGQ
jgi:hypothetical protein